LYLPLALRALITFCPALLDILFKKPLPFLALEIGPLNVRFMFISANSKLVLATVFIVATCRVALLKS
jgi:hypothetical protein